jgi:peptidyl-prolyl cis-trans isomerase C
MNLRGSTCLLLGLCCILPNGFSHIEATPSAKTSTQQSHIKKGQKSKDQKSKDQKSKDQTLKLDPNQVIASVNKIPIDLKAFNTHVALLLSHSKRKKPSLKLQTRAARKAIRLLLTKEMLTQEMKKNKLTTKLPEIQVRVTQRKNALKKIHSTPTRFQTYVNRRGHTLDSYDIYLWNKEVTYTLMKNQKQLEPTAKEVKDLYQRMISRFSRPERVRAKQILIELKADATADQINQAYKKAQKAYKDIMSGPLTFDQILMRDSEGPLKNKYGDIGYFAKGDMVISIEKAVFTLKNKEVSHPVRTRYGWHVLKRMDSVPAYQKSLAEVRDQLVERLSKSKLHKNRTKFLKSLWKKNKVFTQVKL